MNVISADVWPFEKYESALGNQFIGALEVRERIIYLVFYLFNIYLMSIYIAFATFLTKIKMVLLL